MPDQSIFLKVSYTT